MSYSINDIKSLPPSPGIYKYFDKKNQILYIGKAKNLNKRVRSYFSKQHDQDYKTKVLVTKIITIEIIVTKSEKEALILENLLIKSEKPRYNIALKDDKTYPYIKVTMKDTFPRILISRTRFNDGSAYFGPYPSVGSTRKLKQLLSDCFPIRDCKMTITLTEKQRKCVLLDIGKCIGPCIYKEIKPDYDLLIQDLLLFLSGKNAQLKKSLQKKMLEASHKNHFEKAALYRDQLVLLEQLNEKQSVHLQSDDHIQSWVVVEQSNIVYVLVQDIIKGKLLYQKGFYSTRDTIKNAEFLEQCFLAYSNEKQVFPDQILCEKRYILSLKQAVSALNKSINCHAPQRGEKAALLKNTTQNANLAIGHIQSKYDKENRRLEILKQDLNLKKTPQTILGFDISHLQGTHIVASSVCFKQGIPYKAGYRKYIIQSVSGTSNDPASMREVVYRRLQESIVKKDLPDLLLIDGGRAQLNFAYSSLLRLGIADQLDCVSLAKRDEDLYIYNQEEPIKLPKSHSGLQLLQQVRDESHRFALSFQRLKRSKSALTSVLQQIPGLSNKRIKALYEQCNSLEEIATKEASLLSKETLIPLKLIKDIQLFLST